MIRELIPGPIEKALGRFGSHIQFGRDLGIGEVLELVQLQGRPLSAGQRRDRCPHRAGQFRSLNGRRGSFLGIGQKIRLDPIVGVFAESSQVEGG